AALVFLGFVRIKRVLDSAQRHMQRHAALFPTFHQRPIDRAEPKMLAPATNKSVFDLGEITEVIQSFTFLLFSVKLCAPLCLCGNRSSFSPLRHRGFTED